MKTQIKETFEITIIFNRKEAEWLKRFIQNPRCDPEEDIEESIIRKDLFNSLRNRLGK